MDEQHSAARVVDPRAAIVGAAPVRREPFDPAGYLEGRRPPPAPIMPGPPVTVAKPFDPAAFLGESALRGAFNLSTVKPVTLTIDGVELVAVPASAYADALRRITAQEQAAEAVEPVGPVPDPAGMLDLLLSLHSADAVSIGQLTRATGLDHLDIGDRIAAWTAAQPQPLEGELGEDGNIRGVTPEGQRFTLERLPEPSEAPISTSAAGSEAHGAALDDGRETETHGAAIDAAKPKRHLRKSGPDREVPSNPV